MIVNGKPVSERMLALLRGRPMAFVTTMRPDGRMSTNPTALPFDGERIRISTTTNRKKYRNLMADDRITICVVQPDNLNKYVEIRGRATVEFDRDRAFIDSIARQYMDVERYPFDGPGDERVFITVIPERISSPRMPVEEGSRYREPQPKA